MRRASRIISLPASNFIAHASSSTCAVNKHSFTTLTAQQNDHNLHQQSCTGDFLKWGSLGFFRRSSFATGFAPLKPKPLGSIIDVERVKDRSAEDIASAWDDVSLSSLLLYASKCTFHCASLSLCHILKWVLVDWFDFVLNYKILAEVCFICYVG